MTAECSQQAVLNFLKEKGGKVKNADLIEHFKTVFPEEKAEKAAARQTFKNYVDEIAFVKTESGVKYVCLRKKFRVSVKEQFNGTETLPALTHLCADGSDACVVGGGGGEQQEQRTQPVSGYGSDSQVTLPHVLNSTTKVLKQQISGVGEVDDCLGDMGNRASLKRDRSESKKEQTGDTPGDTPGDIPEITLIEASPLPAEGSMFVMPGPAHSVPDGPLENKSVDGLKETSPRDGPVESLSVERTNVVIRRRDSKGSQRRYLESGDGESQADVSSLSGSEGPSSPKGSRQHFIEVMMNSSPQVRRSLVLRHSIHLSSRTDSDTASLASSTLDEDRLTLDPLEHEWMMCASDGEWGSLCLLLATDPSLVLRKDFVTGFTCLHWAAKQGKPELMALIINFAKQHDVPISVNVRSNTGYTPLHVAAMHGHMEVVKLLVGAYNADVEIRDYSGRKACQYLTDNASVDMRDIIGAYERSEANDADHTVGGRWRFSKVLQSNLKPFRLINPAGSVDSVDKEARPRDKVLRRKSSLSRMKPKLQKLRLRTSQIVHSTTFGDTEEENTSLESRPKTHYFW